MKLKDSRENYYFFSTRASDVARQLSFAGLGLIWILRVETSGNQQIPHGLVLPAGLIIVALACDLLQYVYGTLAWGIFNRSKELKGFDGESEFRAPRWINWPTNTFFGGKLLFVAMAYVVLLRYLYEKFMT